MTTQAAAVQARLKQLAASMNTGRNYDPARPVNAASTKQCKYLISLRQQNKIEYERVKASLGIAAPIARMTRREAWRLINTLTTETP